MASRVAEQAGRLKKLHTVDFGDGDYEMSRLGPLAGMVGDGHWWVTLGGYGIECMDSLEHEVNYEDRSPTLSILGFLVRPLYNQGVS